MLPEALLVDVERIAAGEVTTAADEVTVNTLVDVTGRVEVVKVVITAVVPAEVWVRVTGQIVVVTSMISVVTRTTSGVVEGL